PDRLRSATSHLSRVPEAADGDGPEAVAEGERALAVVEDDACREPLADGVSELTEPLEVLLPNGGCRLDLDACELTSGPLQHQVHFGPITITEVVERDRVLVAAGLPPELSVD